MKCPHCFVTICTDTGRQHIGEDNDYSWDVIYETCPNCHKFIISLLKYTVEPHDKSQRVKRRQSVKTKENSFLVYPKGISRAPLSAAVPDIYAQDYKEACLVFSDSPKASAALSRRCLQNLLRDVQKVKHQDLSKEIQEVLDLKVLPSHLGEAIDAVRIIGNFAAHPNKNKNTGEIIDVEQGEAEWLLDVLEGLFDFYFVQPDISLKKKAALNEKLKDAGKPLMK